MNSLHLQPDGGTATGRSARYTTMRMISLMIVSAALVRPVAVSALGQRTQVTASQATSQEPAASGITLQDAIARAKTNEPTFAAAVAANKVAALDHSLARSALLPSVVYHNQYLYTESAHGPSQSANASTVEATSIPRFIANNSVHEYTSQSVVTETIGAQQVTAVKRASALASVASAELEIAQRGLVVTVVSLYYGALAADHKMTVAQRALQEASSFTELTQHREDARESAHADVVKAHLQQQQREREFADAKLQNDKARLDLAVLLFSDPHQAYALVNFATPAPLPTREEMEALASQNNAELKSALASMHAANLDVIAARAAYLPDLGLNFNYGIDAPEFAVHGPDGTRNLGYSATATLDIPVWDWFATHDRVKQKAAMRDSAKVTLTATQRRLVAQLDEFYAEATVARDQLLSLDQSAETARESLRLVRLRYSAGESTVLEVVDAQNSLLTAEGAREDGIIRYQTALANLQILTGTM
jgi:outer membrane protein TolC